MQLWDEDPMDPQGDSNGLIVNFNEAAYYKYSSINMY